MNMAATPTQTRQLQLEINRIVANTAISTHARTRQLTSLFFSCGTRATVQDAARVLIAIEQQATLALLDMPNTQESPEARYPG